LATPGKVGTFCPGMSRGWKGVRGAGDGGAWPASVGPVSLNATPDRRRDGGQPIAPLSSAARPPEARVAHTWVGNRGNTMERNLGHRARAAGWRTLSIALLLGTGLPGGCARPDAVEQEPRPQRAGEPLDVVQTAGTMAGIRASAIVGDQKGVRQGLESLQTDFMRSARIPEVRRRIDRESARTVVSAMDGVASVVWLDATNLLVMVDQNARRSEAMIDRVCLGLEPLGDTLGVVINVQSTAARSG